jgi:hypothetical protein
MHLGCGVRRIWIQQTGWTPLAALRLRMPRIVDLRGDSLKTHATEPGKRRIRAPISRRVVDPPSLTVARDTPRFRASPVPWDTSTEECVSPGCSVRAPAGTLRSPADVTTVRAWATVARRRIPAPNGRRFVLLPACCPQGWRAATGSQHGARAPGLAKAMHSRTSDAMARGNRELIPGRRGGGWKAVRRCAPTLAGTGNSTP